MFITASGDHAIRTRVLADGAVECLFKPFSEAALVDALNAALKAAGEDTRLRVLVLLSEAELTVSDLTQILRQSQPRISRHLKLLVEAGLIERFREGAWAFFRLAEQGGIAVRSTLDLEPGSYLVRLVVRDAEGKAMASRNGSVEIPF